MLSSSPAQGSKNHSLDVAGFVSIETLRPLTSPAVLFFLVIALAVGAFWAFPVYDDGYMMMYLREPGVSFAEVNRDRPIPGYLHEILVRAGGNNPALYVSLNAAMWLVLAFQTRALFQNVFPDLKNYGMVVACLTVAPIVVQVQISVLVVAVTVVLFTILGYAAVLLTLKSAETQGPLRMVLLALSLSAAVFLGFACEYSVTAILSGAVVLTGIAVTSDNRLLRKRLLWQSVCLSALTVAGYIVSTRTADLHVRPEVNPATAVARTWQAAVQAGCGALSGLWYATVAAYASVLGGIRLSWNTKSTIVGVLFAILTAILACYCVDRSPPAVVAGGNRIRALFLAIAIVVGLLPVSLMGRWPALADYDSRVRVPVLPIAVALTMYLCLKLVSTSKRTTAVALLGAMMGYATWTTIYTNLRETKIVDALSSVLKPYVESQTRGITVAVIPLTRLQNELNAHVTAKWPADLERRFWMFNAETAAVRLGSRGACNARMTVDEHIRPVIRTGRVSQVLWVEVRRERAPVIHPYCLDASRSGLTRLIGE